MFNLLETLLARGVIYETHPRGGYYPTRRLFDLAHQTMQGDRFLQLIHGELEALAANTGETVLLAARDQEPGSSTSTSWNCGADSLFRQGRRQASGLHDVERQGDPDDLCRRANNGHPAVAAFCDAPKDHSPIAGKLAANLDTSIHRGWCEDN